MDTLLQSSREQRTDGPQSLAQPSLRGIYTTLTFFANLNACLASSAGCMMCQLKVSAHEVVHEPQGMVWL